MTVVGEPLARAREALVGVPAWLVGGALRDRLLGREVTDLDIVVDGDVEAAARALGRALGGFVFRLSEEFGAWRVLARDRCWHADVSPLRGGSLDADLALRDFTVNAIAEPLAGGEPYDPHGGVADLAARRLRMVSERAFADDPLRVVRAARLACELGMEVESATVAAARARAGAARDVAQERVFAELRRIVACVDVVRGIGLLDEVGATDAVLPELSALRGIEQTRYHHLDVYGHTLEVLAQAVELERDPEALLGERVGARVRALLDEPLADETTRGGALRWGALLHDAAKPATQTPHPDGGFGFPHHDREGAELARAVLGRLRASERLRAHVAALTLHHLRLGFLVHRRPLSAHDHYAYLSECEPVEADVTLLSVADRLATRGRKADEAIERHLELAREILPLALDWRDAGGAPAPLVRGDELARALGLDPGPEVGRRLEALREAQYAGEVATRDDALAFARRL
ncbi:MAG TPA: HDIG domain-containing protein [Solirubrobacteraceae bacterium]|nr:HDIG domain-containing protein [Solirubrobacteraceae bacterium]